MGEKVIIFGGLACIAPLRMELFVYWKPFSSCICCLLVKLNQTIIRLIEWPSLKSLLLVGKLMISLNSKIIMTYTVPAKVFFDSH